MQHALSQYSPDRLCHDNFVQLGVPHMQLTGCVTPQYVAWQPEKIQEAFPATQTSFHGLVSRAPTLIYEFLSTFVVRVPSLLYNYCVHHQPPSLLNSHPIKEVISHLTN